MKIQCNQLAFRKCGIVPTDRDAIGEEFINDQSLNLQANTSGAATCTKTDIPTDEAQCASASMPQGSEASASDRHLIWI